eukprot:scaffold81982_cov30-Phaeocystis_antarctica.AAC.1
MVAPATAYAVAPSLHGMSRVEFLRQIHNHDPRRDSPCTCPLSSSCSRRAVFLYARLISALFAAFWSTPERPAAFLESSCVSTLTAVVATATVAAATATAAEGSVSAADGSGLAAAAKVTAAECSVSAA